MNEYGFCIKHSWPVPSGKVCPDCSLEWADTKEMNIAVALAVKEAKGLFGDSTRLVCGFVVAIVHRDGKTTSWIQRVEVS